ncbi:MAG: SDR family NAD(P)-dependent oxidoreductase, partial [Gemmatimonadota bacterium]
MSDRPCALITGASRGIGRAIAIALAGEGYDIAGNATSYDPGKPGGLAETEGLVERAGTSFLPIPADISDLSTHEGLLRSVLERFGRIDLLVNTAGIAPPERLDYLETTVESYDRVLD